VQLFLHHPFNWCVINEPLKLIQTLNEYIVIIIVCVGNAILDNILQFFPI